MQKRFFVEFFCHVYQKTKKRFSVLKSPLDSINLKKILPEHSEMWYKATAGQNSSPEYDFVLVW